MCAPDMKEYLSEVYVELLLGIPETGGWFLCTPKSVRHHGSFGCSMGWVANSFD